MPFNQCNLVRLYGLELHLTQFANMEQLDGFFASIPPRLHVAWSQRFAEHVVDGSPVWHVMRVGFCRASERHFSKPILIHSLTI